MANASIPGSSRAFPLPPPNADPLQSRPFPPASGSSSITTAPSLASALQTPHPTPQRNEPSEREVATLPPAVPASFVSMPSLGIKRERSPSPLLSLNPILITAGSMRIAPVPEACKNSKPGFQVARKALAQAEMGKLQKLGLRPTRVFTREDGMVIDWTSPVAVMSDTLRPPPLMEAAQGEGEPVPTEAFNPMKKFKVLPADPSSSDAAPPPQPFGIEKFKRTAHPPAKPASRSRMSITPLAIIDLADEGDSQSIGNTPLTTTAMRSLNKSKLTSSSRDPQSRPTSPQAHTSDDLGTCAGSSRLRSPTITPSVLPPPHTPIPIANHTEGSVARDEVLTDAALDFIQRYAAAFFTDRASLAHAYASTALLSVRSPASASSAAHVGRAAVVAALLGLDSAQVLEPHVRCAGGEGGGGAADDVGMPLDYDVVALQREEAVLIITYSSPGSPERRKGKGRGEDTGKGKERARERRADEGDGDNGDGRRWVCEQRFVLRRRELEAADRDAPGLWPFVAVLHQMAVRQLPRGLR
ncbi:uncharacterized protein BXZ73DRAFT_104343 [Epithele typhae]|uniref:uncharacterized protein n=1 Tax=Epithele typhae TaxID=378194 RepID=UPI00200893C7|nr:uncharacterized protein BXZ73DRAFT_104343 [Epithele typhae]KAH9921724.1 hypothetical protein BXZ73DRAFT_104343 [Epithele typhae]